MAKRQRHARSFGWRDGGIALGLFLLAMSVFGQTLYYGFLSYDDRAYVTENPIVSRGLTWSGIVWAFTHAHAGNWHPFTTISHMLDCQMFDLHSGSHHLTNTLLHSAAVLLLFFVLRSMTALPWRSFFVAAVFAVHPLHVESVAWIAERKDVLSAVFFMLTLLAYKWYIQKPASGRYFAVGLAFSAALMAKAMVVTAPLILLLLDYWPLRRLTDFATARKCAVEKIPLFLLSTVCSVVTLVVQQPTTASLENLPFWWRVQNALVATLVYLRQTVWPTELAAFYPHPQGGVPVLASAAAAIVLVGITTATWFGRNRRPYLLVGWLWYLIMLGPVIGIVQVGLQSHADRYMYLPQIGIVLAMVWTVCDFVPSNKSARLVVLTGGVAVTLALAAAAWTQTRYWRENESLWTHALAVTSNNDVAHNNLGNVYLGRGQFDEAIAQFQRALEIRSRESESQYNLGAALSCVNLGTAFTDKGDLDKGIDYYEKAIALAPRYADAHYNLGKALLRQDKTDEAIAQWRATLAIEPNDAEAHASLAGALLRKGELRPAIAEYEAAIKTSEPSVFALNNLAWILATAPDASIRNGPRAVELASGAVRVTHEKVPAFVRTLAAAWAENGRFDAANQAAQHARSLALGHNDGDLAAEIESDLKLYRNNAPLRDQSLSASDAAR